MEVVPLREEAVEVNGVPATKRTFPGGLVHVGGEASFREAEAGEESTAPSTIPVGRRLYGKEPVSYQGLLEFSHLLGTLPYRRIDDVDALTPPSRFHLLCALARRGDAQEEIEGFVVIPDPRGIVYENAGTKYWVEGPVPLVCKRAGSLGEPPFASLEARAERSASFMLGLSGIARAKLLKSLRFTPPAAWLGPAFPASMPSQPLPFSLARFMANPLARWESEGEESSGGTLSLPWDPRSEFHQQPSLRLDLATPHNASLQALLPFLEVID